MDLFGQISRRFTTSLPLLLTPERNALKLELKPYLQPFEEVLALRELRSLLEPDARIDSKCGYYLAYTDLPETALRNRLTYWQRVGRLNLALTVQKALEFTQNGITEGTQGLPLHSVRRLRYGPHDLHEYRGKFFPQLVRSLINISGVAEEAIICDPMAGSGTTPCESLAAGRSAIAADLNPLSVLISRVKSSVLLIRPDAFAKSVNRYLAAFRRSDMDAPKCPWNPLDAAYLHRWFDPTAILDLSHAVLAIRRIRSKFYREFFSVCLSNVVRSVSWQNELDLRVRKHIRPYERGSALCAFRDEIENQVNRIHPYLSVLQSAAPCGTVDVRQGNALDLLGLFPDYAHRVDLLITSPPYATALPYLDTDRLSLIILGLVRRGQHAALESHMIGTREINEKERIKAWARYLERRHELPGEVSGLIDHISKHNHSAEVGFRRRNLPALLGRYFLEMLDAMRSAKEIMRPKSKAYYVVGNNSTMISGQKVEIPTNRFLFEIGRAAGWTQEEVIPMELITSRDIFKENRGSAESILCFRTR
jgi:DNA modification methylase